MPPDPVLSGIRSRLQQIMLKHPLFDLENAEAVTLSGQAIIKNSRAFMAKYVETKYNLSSFILHNLKLKIIHRKNYSSRYY